jgi:hypothetical protein
MWLVSHRDLARVPRIRVLLDWLADTAKTSARRLRGD